MKLARITHFNISAIGARAIPGKVATVFRPELQKTETRGSSYSKKR
jgi:hypothetical protein